MKQNKLKVRWSKRENDLLITYPPGIQTGYDCYYLFSDVFNREFIKEIQERGYDITTLKFEILVDEKSKRFKEKFPTLASEKGGNQ